MIAAVLGAPVLCGAAPAAAQLPTAPSAPVLSHVEQAASRWRERDFLPAFLAGAGLHFGTRFSFVLSEPARAILSFAAETSTRVCVVHVSGDTRTRTCRNEHKVATLSFEAPGGANDVRFSGRLSRHIKLDPGRYRLRLTARDAAGATSQPATLHFTIVG